MSMTPTQARELGQLVASARKRLGLSVRELAAKVAVSPSWITQVETAQYLDVSPDRLARVAQALDIEPARIDRLTGRAMSESLPELRTYFRAKYDLSPEDIEKIERYITRLRSAA
jgi:transcriptional regulator with XRE-family HTH domain